MQELKKDNALCFSTDCWVCLAHPLFSLDLAFNNFCFFEEVLQRRALLTQ
jgi:hypothetical protein